MDAKTYLTDYAAKNHADDPEWISKRIYQKIQSVGGLLSEEGATMLVAEEKGWIHEEKQVEPPKEKRYEMPVTQYTDLTNQMFDLIFDTSKGGEKTKYPNEPLVVRIERIYDAKKPENDYSSMETSAKVTDGYNIAYFNFQDKPEFTKGDKTFPANFMSSSIQQVRPQLIGKTVAIYKWQLYRGESKYYLGSTNFTYFKVVDPSNFTNGIPESEIIEDLYEEVPIDEIAEEGV